MIECVHRLPQLEQHVVGDIDDVAGRPYASGAHPYVCVGDAVEDLELTLPARERVLVDDRQLPTGTEPATGAYDFSSPRAIGEMVLDDGFGSLDRVDGRATTTLVDPTSGRGVALWVDEQHRWLQVFTPPSDGRRPAIAVEPMTAPADAFNSGRSLRRLAPGESWTLEWGADLVG